ncbi:WAT1-related protein [Ananas comosus]|uniref:WAT1-related protein n=1 Tax=Ananas comosus TaxID=4615 RepID=A0A199V509_ANACO|nr:WAT1-related protein [Ananas comosus]
MEGPSERKRPFGACRELKPYIFMIFVQLSFAGMTIVAKFALNEGMSPFTFVVYRHILAAVVVSPFAWFFERSLSSILLKKRVQLTYSIVLKIIALGLLEPVLDQNLYYLGMKKTSAAFTAAMSNLLPAITFVMAWVLRLERVSWNEKRSLAKVIGTTVSVSGAMVMTLYKGPLILRGSSISKLNREAETGTSSRDFVKGSLFLIFACSSWSGFMILQAITLRDYPLEFTVTAMTCLSGAALGAVSALVKERNAAAWKIGWDLKLVTVAYSVLIDGHFVYFLILHLVSFK